ncbi:MAG: zf-HC2 domain-containing protein, partial [Calditrichaeota bacterium]
IFDYVDGLLSIKNRKEVDRHIKGCNTCRDLYHRATDIKAKLKALPRIKTSSNFETILRTRISMERSLSWRAFRWRANVPMYAISIAVVVVAVFLVANLRSSNPVSLTLSQPTVSTQPQANFNADSQTVNFPLDVVRLQGGGTPLNSEAVQRDNSTPKDSTRDFLPENVHTVEF